MITDLLRWLLGVPNTNSPPTSVAASDTVIRRRSGSTEVDLRAVSFSPAEADPAEDLDDESGAGGVVLGDCRQRSELCGVEKSLLAGSGGRDLDTDDRVATNDPVGHRDLERGAQELAGLAYAGRGEAFVGHVGDPSSDIGWGDAP